MDPNAAAAGKADGVQAALERKASTELASGEVAPTLYARIEAWVVGGLALGALACAPITSSCAVFFRRQRSTRRRSQVYLIVWSVFLALGLVTAADRHVKADLFVNLFPARLRHGVNVFSDLLGLAFSLLLVWYGTAITWQAWSFGDLSTTSLRFPLWIFMAALPTGALLMSVRLCDPFGGRLQKVRAGNELRLLGPIPTFAADARHPDLPRDGGDRRGHVRLGGLRCCPSRRRSSTN